LNDSLRRSLKIAEVRSSSLNTFCGALRWVIFPLIFSHFSTRLRKSASSSATFLFSAFVLTMMPKLFGLILIKSLLSRARSSLLLIFWEMDILFEKGITTRYLPGKDISVEIRGPFVEIGSLAICTRICCPGVNTLVIFPVFTISGSGENFSKVICFVLPCKPKRTYLLRVWNFCKSLWHVLLPIAERLNPVRRMSRLVAVLSLVHNKIDVTMLSVMRSSEEVGWYSIGYRLNEMFIMLAFVISSLSTTFLTSICIFYLNLMSKNACELVISIIRCIKNISIK